MSFLWKLLTVLGLVVAIPASGQTAPNRSLSLLSRLNSLMYYPADPGKSSWLITSTSHASNSGVEVNLVANKNGNIVRLWHKSVAEAYDPVVYYEPQWTYQGKSVLILQYQLGAGWTILTVIGLSAHGPLMLQQLEGGLFDITYATSVDGNGDLRLRDTSEPFGFHCYNWLSANSTFSEHPCKSLKGSNPQDTH